MEQKRSMDKNAKIAIVAVSLAVIAYAVGKVATLILNQTGGDTIMTPVVIRTVIAVAAMIALGGASMLRPSWRSIRETFGFALPLFIVNLIMGFSLAMGVLVGLMEETISPEQFVSIGGYATVLCILVGINEEAMFRGLVFGGLLAKWGGNANGVLRAAVVSALAFGFIHVAFTMDYSNVYSIGSGLMKTLETGMFGFIFCVPVLKGKNITGAMLAHAFFDWVVLCGQSIQAGQVTTTNYAQSDPQIATVLMIMFGILSLIYLPRTIHAYKELRNMEPPQYGPFVK